MGLSGDLWVVGSKKSGTIAAFEFSISIVVALCMDIEGPMGTHIE